jgi:hypothetical protein
MYFIDKIRQAERGNALILSVLILLSLTSVGIVSVQRTNTDLMVTANLVRAKQAHMGGESGTAHGMIQMAETLNMVIEDMQQRNRLTGSVDRSFELCKFSSSIPDPANTGKNQYMPIVEPPAAVAETVGRIRQDMAFLVDVMHVDEVQGMQGYSVEEAGCFQSFDFNATGAIPTANEQTVEDTIENSDSLVVRNRARALVGPWACTRR